MTLVERVVDASIRNKALVFAITALAALASVTSLSRMPLDAIPDLSPFIGYTDDLGVLMYGLVMIAAYIDQDVRASARHTLFTWIGHISESRLRKIDDLL